MPLRNPDSRIDISNLEIKAPPEEKRGEFEVPEWVWDDLKNDFENAISKHELLSAAWFASKMKLLYPEREVDFSKFHTIWEALEKRIEELLQANSEAISPGSFEAMKVMDPERFGLFIGQNPAVWEFVKRMTRSNFMIDAIVGWTANGKIVYPSHYSEIALPADQWEKLESKLELVKKARDWDYYTILASDLRILDNENPNRKIDLETAREIKEFLLTSTLPQRFVQFKILLADKVEVSEEHGLRLIMNDQEVGSKTPDLPEQRKF